MGLLLATLAGCTKLEDRTCDSNTDCEGEGGLCDLSVGLCYQGGTEPEIPDECSPACAAYEACTTAGCRSRFTSLTILSPANNAVLGGGTVQVQARLEVNPTYASTTELPETLIFSAARNGGGDVGSFGNVTRSGDTYTIQWTPPTAEAQITLTASHPTPTAVPSAAVNVQVDTQAPTLTIAFSNPPTRSTGGSNQADQRDPTSGFGLAFRRDETVTVTVSANEPVNNLTLTVVGIGPGGTPGQSQSPVAVQPGGNCSGGPAFCGTVAVDLSAPEMRDVRGTMDFRVEGVDAAGNKGTASAGLKVTRWKWAFDAVGEILGTPAIGNRGAIYIGTKALGSGKAIAIAPDGVRNWEAVIGDALGSPAVGGFASNEEFVYVAAKSPTNVPTFYAFRGIAGTERHRCTYSGSAALPGAIAVGTTQGTSGASETGITIHPSSPGSPQVRIAQLRPTGGLLGAAECSEIASSTIPVNAPGGAVVLQGQNLFYGTADFKVTSYDLATDSNAPRTNWPQDTTYLARGLALLGNTLYGGASSSDNPGQGSLFSMPTTGGPLSIVHPNTPVSRVFTLAIGSGNVAYFGAETSSANELLSLVLTTAGAMPTRAGAVGTLRGAPVVAKNDRLYTLNNQGRVAAWTASTLAPLWEADLPPGSGTADVSPTLDCRRDGAGQAVAGLGTLYAAAATKLYALIVDSPGLDPNAPWPKFQHDARNTGNPATPITNCP
jgi:hypothetical protein